LCRLTLERLQLLGTAALLIVGLFACSAIKYGRADYPIDHNLRYLLAAVAAALRGRTDLASVLQYLDAVQDICPSCGSAVFPDELQEVIARDQTKATAIGTPQRHADMLQGA
jgi:hypothetical protein